LNSSRISMSEIYPIITEMLETDGKVTIKVSGWSMQPMVYHLRDTVTLIKPPKKLKKYDLPFYRTSDGRFIMHRIIKVHKDGTYTCQGDNLWEKEFPVMQDQIFAVVDSFCRNGKNISVNKSISYWLYTRTWWFFHHFKKYYKYIKIRK